ncbi:hypothetical protein [Amycolatopsis viridis]|uniref:Uncharacterized protein n=1 Tax=Amycolatopsis viridis TaxID=185678 RepID=A0ABX0SZI5_9PSEU|nr:hypothetical protein [Amycolatopsis viridis]NIH81059.1 hypothetical protein [Amycolatopsis viridis]
MVNWSRFAAADAAETDLVEGCGVDMARNSSFDGLAAAYAASRLSPKQLAGADQVNPTPEDAP